MTGFKMHARRPVAAVERWAEGDGRLSYVASDEIISDCSSFEFLSELRSLMKSPEFTRLATFCSEFSISAAVDTWQYKWALSYGVAKFGVLQNVP